MSTVVARCAHGFVSSVCRLCLRPLCSDSVRVRISTLTHASPQPVTAAHAAHRRPAKVARVGRQTKLCGHGFFSCVECGGKPSMSPGERVFRDYAKASEKRGITFELSLARFWWLREQPCAYCGNDATGIDRVDNDRGYTYDNCVPACHKCNIAKYTRTTGVFLAHASAIATYTPTHDHFTERWESLRADGPE